MNGEKKLIMYKSLKKTSSKNIFHKINKNIQQRITKSCLISDQKVKHCPIIYIATKCEGFYNKKFMNI